MSTVLCHHGVKGQRWGVRRYQYQDGSLTPAGRKRYNGQSSQNGVGKLRSAMSSKVSEVTKRVQTTVTGRQYVDGVLKKGTTFSRIQSKEDFEDFAFYATYKKQDIEKYLGLFGKNLQTRANWAAKNAEKNAKTTGSEDDLLKAKELRDAADNIKVYQLKIEATRKLKIPSDENAGDITAKLLKESQFRDDVIASISDAKSGMKRPTQQLLFNQAEKALRQNPDRMSNSEKVAVYKALNLSLTLHNEREISAQNRFYGELKKKGYNALLDYNDKDYSSYHAKRPMIVFDTSSVKLSAVISTDPKVVDKLYAKYNAERVRKEASANTVGLVSKYASKTVSECSSYVDRKYKDYLGLSSTKSSHKTQVDRYKKEHPNTKMSDTEIAKMLQGT